MRKRALALLFSFKSVRPDDPMYGPVLLYIAKGNEPMPPFLTCPRGIPKPAERITDSANGQVFPRWGFNDVPVEPGKVYHFIATELSPTKPLTIFPTVWTHAPESVDTQTIMPHSRLPAYEAEDARFHHCES